MFNKHIQAILLREILLNGVVQKQDWIEEKTIVLDSFCDVDTEIIKGNVLLAKCTKQATTFYSDIKEFTTKIKIENTIYNVVKVLKARRNLIFLEEVKEL